MGIFLYSLKLFFTSVALQFLSIGKRHLFTSAFYFAVLNLRHEKNKLVYQIQDHT